MLVSKNPRAPNANPRAPNTSQWNIVGVGYARVGFVVAMYISCCLCMSV